MVLPGSEVVDWLHRNVEGFTDRREARKYAGNLLKAGYIRHTINKVTFSEQCYYVFGDLCGGEDSHTAIIERTDFIVDRYCHAKGNPDKMSAVSPLATRDNDAPQNHESFFSKASFIYSSQ